MTNFHRMFIERWEREKNPLRVLYEYENIRKGPKESVQDYCTRFNSTYNAISTNLKPPPNLAMMKYPDGFDLYMAYQLRKREPATLEQSQTNVVKVATNILAKKAQAKLERRVRFADVASTSNGKVDLLAKTIETIMDILDNLDRKTWGNQQASLVRNANFRRNQNQDQNTGKNGLDQNIRPPFQENYAESSNPHDGEQDTQINLMGLDNQNPIFLSQDEEELHMLQ